MKILISNDKNITVSEIINQINCGVNLTIVYKIQSEQPYYAFLTCIKNYKTFNTCFGFIHNIGFNRNPTYISDTIEDSLKLALSAGKQILVFNRDEQSELFKNL